MSDSELLPRPRYPILVTDVDGTLIDGRHAVLPANAEAIQRFRERGGRVVLATGRTEQAVVTLRDELALTGPAILYNGARVVELTTGEVLAQWPVPVGVDAVVRLVRSLDSRIVAIAYGPGRAVLLSPPSPEADAVLAAYEAKDGIAVDRSGVASVDLSTLLKVLFIVPGELTAAVSQQLRVSFAGNDVISSEPTYLELVGRGVSKGSALAWLLDHWGVDGEQVVAIGDHLNDRELLGIAAVGVAVGDGHIELRAGADLVVGMRDAAAVADAVAIALGEYRSKGADDG